MLWYVIKNLHRARKFEYPLYLSLDLWEWFPICMQCIQLQLHLTINCYNQIILAQIAKASKLFSLYRQLYRDSCPLTWLVTQFVVKQFYLEVYTILKIVTSPFAAISIEIRVIKSASTLISFHPNSKIFVSCGIKPDFLGELFTSKY